jgi:hypothetical protein
MLTKHIDVIALLVIGLGLLAFSKASELRLVPEVHAAGFQVQNAVHSNPVCPLDALIARFR